MEWDKALFLPWLQFLTMRGSQCAAHFRAVSGCMTSEETGCMIGSIDSLHLSLAQETKDYV
jgi:hypothetical protein